MLTFSVNEFFAEKKSEAATKRVSLKKATLAQKGSRLKSPKNILEVKTAQNKTVKSTKTHKCCLSEMMLEKISKLSDYVCSIEKQRNLK